ncbi:MAG: hypothetical protein KJ893_05760 [Candidatus Omnitrophica bacterium]|nr:hypothetical protein [Candidatus Omnitrophota bacterium]MBU4479102.1 hypothetical protein [Candidatus Omnitrophota bacterium]MCG2703421.1 hypothetical protein [Candidatus Omnitrophota bacterium]
MNNRGQVLLFVFFLLLVVGILSSGISVLWQADTGIRTQEQFGSIAFYLAQGAVERAKAEVLRGYWAAGTSTISDQNDLDIASDPQQYLYSIQIINSGGTTRTLTGTGRVLDLAGNEIAYRQIRVIVDGIQDSALPAGEDDDLTGTNQAWTWREI